MGSPDFAVPALKALHRRFLVAGVVSQPDRPAGRKKLLQPPAVKTAAMALNLPLLQPLKMRDTGVFDQIKQWNPDVIVVAAYGQLLPRSILDLPFYGCVNVHPSLLPRWRGASPIPYALLAGDLVSGVSIMQMDASLDTGPVLNQVRCPILPGETAAMLTDKYAEIGADLLVKTLEGLQDGLIHPTPQDESCATYSRLILKEDGKLDSSRSILWAQNQIRAYDPWPGLWFVWKDQPVKILKASGQASLPGKAGEHFIVDGFPAVQLEDGLLLLERIQPAGKNAMDGKAFLRGARDWL